MKKCAHFSPYMRRPLVIYDFAPDPVNFLIVYEENFIFFFISDHYKEKEQMTKIIDSFSKKQKQVCEIEKKMLF
jgi:hypothetical protein